MLDCVYSAPSRSRQLLAQSSPSTAVKSTSSKCSATMRVLASSGPVRMQLSKAFLQPIDLIDAQSSPSTTGRATPSIRRNNTQRVYDPTLPKVTRRSPRSDSVTCSACSCGAHRRTSRSSRARLPCASSSRPRNYSPICPPRYERSTRSVQIAQPLSSRSTTSR